MNSDSQLLHHLNSTRHKVIYKTQHSKIAVETTLDQYFYDNRYFKRTLEDFQAGIIPYTQQTGATVPVVTGTTKRKSESSLGSQSSE